MKEIDRTTEKAGDEPVRDDEQRKLDALTEALPPDVGPLPPASQPGPKKTIGEAIKEASNAQRVYDAARRKLEEGQKQLDAELAKLKEERRRFEQLPAQERDLYERTAKLEQRERNAEKGFAGQREEILGDISREREQLRKERAEADAELARLRSEQEQRWREEQAARLARWQKEEEERSRTLGAQVQKQQDDLRRQREEALARLTREMDQMRARFEQQCRDREQALEKKEKDLIEQDIQRIIQERRVRAAREELKEDREALTEKVNRLVREQTMAERQELDRLRAELEHVRAERDSWYKRAQEHQAVDRQFGGVSPGDILAQIDGLRRTNEALRSQLAERPTLQERQRLGELETQQGQWREERAGLEARLCELQTKLAQRMVASHQLESLRSEKEALETHSALLRQVITGLQSEVEKYTKQAGQKHPMEALIAIDQDTACQKPIVTAVAAPEAPLDLKTLVHELQRRLYHQNPRQRLFYPEHELRRFVAGMAQSRLALLQGISGTGKTSLPLGIAQALGAEKEIVAVQAGWRDRQDLLGHYNALHGKYHATNFVQALYRAHSPSCADRPFLILLDEINLSRVEQFFADVLSALEQPEGQRRLTLLDEPVPQPPKHMVDGRHLPLPENVWFVGTANHDESTVEFADKTYDRSLILELERSAPPTQPPVSLPTRQPLSLRWLQGQFDEAQKNHATQAQTCKQWLLGAAPMLQLERSFGVRWGNRFERDLERFVPVLVAAGGQPHEALDHLLVTKVLRKLRGRHDVQASQLETLLASFHADTAFGSKLPRCQHLLEREIAARGGEVLP